MRLFILELKRALKEKNFWIIIILLLIMSVLVTLPNFLPEKLNVIHDSTKVLKLSINAVDLWRSFLSSRILTTFIVLFPVLIYTHSFVDDMNSKYINNIITRIGLKNYFINKFLVCIFLGGSLLFIISVGSFTLFHIIYTGDTNHAFKATFVFIDYKINIYNPVQYMFIISTIMFFTGMVYSAIGFLISLYTDNKMLIYGLATLSLRLYEAILYLVSHFIAFFSQADYNVYYLTYSIFNDLGDYSDLKLLCIYIFIFAIIIGRIRSKYNSIKLEYLRA